MPSIDAAEKRYYYVYHFPTYRVIDAIVKIIAGWRHFMKVYFVNSFKYVSHALPLLLHMLPLSAPFLMPRCVTASQKARKTVAPQYFSANAYILSRLMMGGQANAFILFCD